MAIGFSGCEDDLWQDEDDKAMGVRFDLGEDKDGKEEVPVDNRR